MCDRDAVSLLLAILKHYYELQLAQLRANLRREFETKSTQTFLTSPMEITPKYGSTDSLINILHSEPEKGNSKPYSIPQKSSSSPKRSAGELASSISPQDETSEPKDLRPGFLNKSTQTFLMSPARSPPLRAESPKAYHSEPSLVANSSTTGSLTKQIEETLRSENEELRSKCAQLQSQMEQCTV